MHEYGGPSREGVSVWLSLAWLRANKLFTELEEIMGSKDDKAEAAARSKEMQEMIENHGWDGEYYLCAYKDWEEKIGSKEYEEGKLFLIPQIWSVFSGVSDCGREIIAMDAVEKTLSSELGTLIGIPPYTKYNARIGSVTQKPAAGHWLEKALINYVFGLMPEMEGLK